MPAWRVRVVAYHQIEAVIVVPVRSRASGTLMSAIGGKARRTAGVKSCRLMTSSDIATILAAGDSVKPPTQSRAPSDIQAEDADGISPDQLRNGALVDALNSRDMADRIVFSHVKGVIRAH